MLDQYIPGTNIPYTGNDISGVIRTLIISTDGLTLSQVCRITGLETSTIQNWVKRGYLFRPVKKKYYERHMSRILLISALRDCMKIEEIGDLMAGINGELESEDDDIVSETSLYEYFCQSIHSLNEKNIYPENIDAVIEKVLEGFSGNHKGRLICALRVMIYAYISGICMKYIKDNLEEMRSL